MKFFHIYNPIKRLAGVLSLASALLLLSSCANYQKIQTKNAPLEKVNITVPDSIKEQGGVALRDKWWDAFGDSQLNSLIEQAVSTNPSMEMAHSRIARARAIYDLNQAASGPQINGVASASYGRQSGNYLVPKEPMGVGGTYFSQGLLGADFNYDLDVWGKYAAQIRVAQSQVGVAVFEREATRLFLTTTICRAYLQLASQYELYDVLLAYQVQHDAISDLNRLRVKSGLDTQVELKKSETDQAILRTGLVQLGTAIEATRLQLAALAGKLPEFTKEIRRPAISNIPLVIPPNLPLDLLGRRPDLAAQRARIRAAIGEVDAAEAQFYPNISLTGMIGFQSVGLENLLKSGSLVSGIGPALHLPIFDSGRLRANYASKAADLDAAISQYNQSVITAAQEVAEQLTRVASLTQEEKFTKDSLIAAEEAHRLAMRRYRGGLSSYLAVLTVEMPLLFQRRATVELKAKRHDLQIALVRALGGGFVDESLLKAAEKAPIGEGNFNKMAGAMKPAHD